MAAPQISEETKVTLDLKTIGMIVAFVITIAIMDTQEDVEEIKETIDKIDQRLYEIQSKQR